MEQFLPCTSSSAWDLEYKVLIILKFNLHIYVFSEKFLDPLDWNLRTVPNWGLKIFSCLHSEAWWFFLRNVS